MQSQELFDFSFIQVSVGLTLVVALSESVTLEDYCEEAKTQAVNVCKVGSVHLHSLRTFAPPYLWSHVLFSASYDSCWFFSISSKTEVNERQSEVICDHDILHLQVHVSSPFHSVEVVHCLCNLLAHVLDSSF